MENFGNAFSTDRFGSVSQLQDQRLTKSEATSPLPDGLSTGAPAGMPAALAPIQTNIPGLWSQPWGSASTQPDPLFSSAEEDSAVSAGISPSGDFNFYSWPSFDSGYNFIDPLPALTSGEGSENEAFDNEADDFISPGIALNPFGSLTRTNTGSSIFSLDHPADFSTGEMVDNAKYLESAVATTMGPNDSLFTSAPPPPAGIFDEQFAQWMDIIPESQPNMPMWDQQL